MHSELSKVGKQLSIADSPWSFRFSKETVKCIDQLQIMAYDLYDHNGDQNSYAGAVDSAVRSALNKVLLYNKSIWGYHFMATYRW